jgi:hypothetical protein
VTSAADVTSSAPEAGVLLLARRHHVWTALGLAARAGSDRGGAARGDRRGGGPRNLRDSAGGAVERPWTGRGAGDRLRPRGGHPVGLYGYQWQLERARFVLFDSRRDPVPRLEWVIAGASWRQARTVGAQRVWVHAPYRQALWHLPAGR